MASRYAVGGSFTWDASNTAHWSTSSGGAGGASVPTAADDVFIDANSGSSPIITVTALAFCLSLNFTGAITPTLAGSASIQIAGNFTLISTLTPLYTGQFSFQATATGKTVTTAGLSLASDFLFNGTTGGWTLQDNLNTTGNVNYIGASLDTNNKNIACANFTSTFTNTRSLTLGSSTITVSGNFTISGSLFTLSPGTSTIVMTGATKTFAGNGLTFNNVTFLGTPTTITGSNTFNILTFTVGKIINITSGTTQTVTSLVAQGTPSSKVTIQSTIAGTAATLNRASGNQVVRNITLKDITATGGATFYALGTTSVSGNTGWLFQMLIKQEKVSGSEMALYHIDGSGVLQKVSG